MGPAQQHIANGTLTPIAVFGDKRLNALPNVPTVKELGYNVGSPVYYGILAPKDTPKEIVNAIYGAAKKTVDKYNDQISKNLTAVGAQIGLLGPDEYREYLEHQKELFAKGVKLVE